MIETKLKLEMREEGNRILDYPQLFDRDYVLKSILPRVVSREYEQSIEEAGVIYERVLDMDVVFHVLLDHTEAGLMSVSITNRLLDQLELERREIMDASIRNMATDIEIQSIENVLRECCGEETIEMENNSNILVISNRRKIYGAAAILCSDALNAAARYLGSSIVLLPSSVHEILALSYTPGIEQELKPMVEDINRAVVEPKERLTDSVYLYEKGKLCVIA